MNDNKILIIEDETTLSEILKKQFEDSGFVIRIAADGFAGKKMAESKEFDLIIMDINLPLINGYDLCAELRKNNNNVPVIMLTALGTIENKLSGFGAGADDYLTKPFEFKELLARVNALLKRQNTTNHVAEISISNLVIDTENKTVSRAGKRIELTSREYMLLEHFVKNRGKLLSRENIVKNVWDIDFDPGTNVLDVYVNYLRKKIDKDFEPKLIHTKFGFGFYCNDTEI
jgi:two-component system, OmpR family, copper resistance phosphate regulon response regulator CusR